MECGDVEPDPQSAQPFRDAVAEGRAVLRELPVDAAPLDPPLTVSGHLAIREYLEAAVASAVAIEDHRCSAGIDPVAHQAVIDPAAACPPHKEHPRNDRRRDQNASSFAAEGHLRSITLLVPASPREFATRRPNRVTFGVTAQESTDDSSWL
jgi:hypothetical protein